MTIRGLGFRSGISEHMNYTCTFILDEEKRQMHVLNLAATLDNRVDARAQVVSSTELTCTVPLWHGAAATVRLLVLECSESRCFVLPSVHGAETFQYKEEWFGISQAGAGLQGSAAGNETLYILGLGFRHGAGYRCRFASQTANVTMSTIASTLNTTHAACLTPLWGPAGHGAQTVRFELLKSLSMCAGPTCGITYSRAAIMKISSETSTSFAGTFDKNESCNLTACVYTFFALWQSISTSPNLYTRSGAAELLAKGGKTIYINGMAFSEDLAVNCSFRSPAGEDLIDCSVVARCVSAFKLECVTEVRLLPRVNDRSLLTYSGSRF